jgi:NAD(P)-dependent dehydrogenase (short-subunit alcohol dehydrogenase family)
MWTSTVETMADLGLRGRVALVTGATQGIGRRVARLFASEGVWIAINYFSDSHGAKSLLDEIRSEGGRALLAPGSARDPEGAWRLARYVELEWAQIDILIHGAGLLEGHEAVPDIRPLLHELLPAMQQRHWGRVVDFGMDGTTAESIYTRQFQAVLANVIEVSDRKPDDHRADAAAQLALFLGSPWNVCITSHTFGINDCIPKEGPHDAR